MVSFDLLNVGDISVGPQVGSGQAANVEIPLCASSARSFVWVLTYCPYSVDGADGVSSAVALLEDHALFPHTGIFAYLNYHVPRTRREILETLIKGLQRLEYRGYDSAGTALGAVMVLV